MSQFFLFAFLPGHDHGLARIPFQQNGTPFTLDKILGPDLPAIDQREGEAVGDGTELFSSIKSRASAARPGRRA